MVAVLHATQVPSRLPPLEAGDHLDQATFHARYKAMPPSFHAELIGGMVMAGVSVSVHRKCHRPASTGFYSISSLSCR